MILPTGSAGRLVELRRRLVQALDERDRLRHRSAADANRIDLLEHQLERIDAELRALQAWATRRPEWQLRRVLRRLARSLRGS